MILRAPTFGMPSPEWASRRSFFGRVEVSPLFVNLQVIPTTKYKESLHMKFICFLLFAVALASAYPAVTEFFEYLEEDSPMRGIPLRFAAIHGGISITAALSGIGLMMASRRS